MVGGFIFKKSFLKVILYLCAQELRVTGCSEGVLTGDHILLHAASRCKNISHLDVSWCNVNDNGLMGISESSNE